MAADRRLYVFRVTEDAWNALVADVRGGELAGVALTGLEVRRALVGSDRAVAVVASLGGDAEAFDADLPGGDTGFLLLYMAAVESGADPFAVDPTASDAAKTALASASVIT